MSEFDLINQTFKTTAITRDDVNLGIGDDCAILSPPDGKQLAVSTDTLIAGVHFPLQTTASDIGYKSLAVNLSDLAAMGAQPAWASLAITLPEDDAPWLNEFMSGFNELAKQYNLTLIGGDTTRGHLSITISVIGFVSPDKILKRSQASIGDFIYLTGTIGDARKGLEILLENPANLKTTSSDIAYCLQRLNRPTPAIEAGQILSSFNGAAIDLSDGLLSDLGHICEQSHVGAVIQLENIPLSQSLRNISSDKPDWNKIVNAGDDYELCFTVSPQNVESVESLFKNQNINISRIGIIAENPGVQCYIDNQLQSQLKPCGYNHFA